MNKLTDSACELCQSSGAEPLWRDALCRVVLVEDRDYPGYCRVILNRHVREMTDLDAAAREHVMRVVFAAEQALRDVMHPDKINLASLGNKVAHLHWHVIARYADDRHFPGSVWSEAQRAGSARTLDRDALRGALHKLLQAVAE